MKQIRITIAANGEVEIKAEGFAGKSCKTATTFIEKALRSIAGRTLSSDYYQTKTENQLHQKQD